MSRQTTILCLVVSCLAAAAPAQELERTLCHDDDDAPCLGVGCICVDDRLELVFGGQAETSAWEYDDPDAIVPGRVYMDVASGQVRGYTFGVAYDSDLIRLLPGSRGLNIGDSVNGDPLLSPVTATLPASDGGMLSLRRNFVGDQEVGFTLSAVLGFRIPVVLPVGRQPLVNCNFELLQDVGSRGTRLTIEPIVSDTSVSLAIDQLVFPDEVPLPEGNCIDGEDNDADGLVDRDDTDCVQREAVSGVPRRVVDGVVRRRTSTFRRGDIDNNGRVDITDAIGTANFVVGAAASAGTFCEDALDADDSGSILLTDALFAFNFLFLSGPAPPPPLNDCALDPTPDALGCDASECG